MSQEPLVALTLPMGSRSIRNDGAAEGFFFDPSLRGIKRILFRFASSMLPRCFNMLWCSALNARQEHPITHFAMIHDDIVPQSGWLDVLMEEMNQSGADFISALVPIKDELGLTSTAIDVGNQWLVRRLTLAEAFEFPETFTLDDVPFADSGRDGLLPNTGLFLCKFDQAWVEQVVFQWQNSICQLASGQWVTRDFSEDWDFGRQLNSLGKKIAVTRKVKLIHEQRQWHNQCVWGEWKTDESFMECMRPEHAARLEVAIA